MFFLFKKVAGPLKKKVWGENLFNKKQRLLKLWKNAVKMGSSSPIFGMKITNIWVATTQLQPSYNPGISDTLELCESCVCLGSHWKAMQRIGPWHNLLYRSFNQKMGKSVLLKHLNHLYYMHPPEKWLSNMMVHWNLEPQQRRFKPLLTHFLQLSSTSGGSTCGSKVVTANKPRSQAKMTNFVGNKSSTIDISRLQLQPQSAHQCNATQRCGGLHLPFSPVPCTSTDAPQTFPNML